MFYLLENNRIIETEKEYEVEYIKDTYFNSQNEYKFVYVKDIHYQGLQVLRNATTEENIGFIKKQSKNVFDLIEMGDLVRVLNTIVKVEEIMKNTVMATTLNEPFDVTMIDAIYKPDDKGNYIKVWERKKDE